ncbi:putative inactive methylesterase 20 [Glycine soja]|uniref:putative inactive methylesterase 20 n=1 Tax=Glycine soja TaxID=3848 RepID=UPI0003DE8413|nr:putative inactive methylesterase 20 [Glycine soja]|eukprot:XP_006577623.1 putative inactive methylesterase 20 [Glycine max]
MVGTYVPVDGSFRGAWCWYKVANKLKSEGHNRKKVILVGHGLGGISVSVAMGKYPENISVAVCITATVVSETEPHQIFFKMYFSH